MHPDNRCNWDGLDVGGKQSVLEVDQGDGEQVEKSVACMLHVVCVPNISLVPMANVCLGCVPHNCHEEKIGGGTGEKEPTAGQQKPGFSFIDICFA